MSTVRPPAPPPAPPTEVLPKSARRLSWWQRGWGVAAIGIVCLVIGVGIGAGSSGKKSKPGPTTAQLAAQATATKERIHQEAVTKAAAGREQVATERKEAAERAAEHRSQVRHEKQEAAERRQEQAKEREEEARKKAEETKTYSGAGGQNLGTIHVPVESTLTWECPSCTSDNFQIFNGASDSNEITVNALNQTSGKTHIDEGSYHDVLVNTEGESWTIHIAPDE
jgi:hypothetical protein